MKKKREKTIQMDKEEIKKFNKRAKKISIIGIGMMLLGVLSGFLATTVEYIVFDIVCGIFWLGGIALCIYATMIVNKIPLPKETKTTDIFIEEGYFGKRK